jgi:hypothetical protein
LFLFQLFLDEQWYFIIIVIGIIWSKLNRTNFHIRMFAHPREYVKLSIFIDGIDFCFNWLCFMKDIL